jgi:hypothetical protein
MDENIKNLCPLGGSNHGALLEYLEMAFKEDARLPICLLPA